MLDVTAATPQRFPWCTAIAVGCAVLSHVGSLAVTAHELSAFAPGEHIRFVVGGFLVAVLFVVFTIAWAIGGAFVEHRIGTNFIAVLVAIASLPVSHYAFQYMVAARHLVPEP